MRKGINEALRQELKRDQRVLILGEEVDQYNGAYKVTELLGAEFPGRVIDTPITEMGFTGLAVGAAFKGLRPVVEFMSFNFALQAIDQIINGAAKARYMSGGKLQCPIVFRGPDSVAAGVAAQHSQCLAPYFASIPGLNVLSICSTEDALGLTRAAIRDDNPTILLESELLYGVSFPVSPEMLDENFVIPIGKAKIERKGTDISIFAHGRGVMTALNGAAKLAEAGISAEVINLRTLRPLDRETIINSVKKTSRAMTVEESYPCCSVGSEVISIVVESEAFYYLDAPVERVAFADVPMPYAPNLEDATVPKASDVIEVAKRIVSKSLPAKK